MFHKIVNVQGNIQAIFFLALLSNLMENSFKKHLGGHILTVQYSLCKWNHLFIMHVCVIIDFCFYIFTMKIDFVYSFFKILLNSSRIRIEVKFFLFAVNKTNLVVIRNHNTARENTFH